jgi:hypothetical protein
MSFELAQRRTPVNDNALAFLAAWEFQPVVFSESCLLMFRGENTGFPHRKEFTRR